MTTHTKKFAILLLLSGLLFFCSCSVDQSIPIGALEHFQRGNQYQQELDYRAAINEYSMAIQEDPDQKSFHYNLGIAYFSLQYYEKSAASYHEALEIDPEFADAWYNLSLSLEKSNQIEDAFHAYEKYQKLLRVAIKIK
ncbi:MAG: tetratricopeptide repeat protein [Proteobacteria bacterium]|nr:tetratricopeptide repeat protein [Pseudomonadota bacterium]